MNRYAFWNNKGGTGNFRRQSLQVPNLVRQLYAIVAELESLFPGRHFTLDGHIVGSIGEVLAAARYDLVLVPASSEGYDAKAQDGRFVEVKATQGDSVGLRSEPQHLIVLRILADGQAVEVYNGPGTLPWAQAGPLQSNGQRNISLGRLTKLMSGVPQASRLRPRAARP